jgi:arylsulfatase A-like enzyme
VLCAATCSPVERAPTPDPIAAADEPSAQVAPAQPNVLLLVMDTVRADRCGFLEYPRPTTPQIARFAQEGIVYTDAWSPSRWTVPSHASLFTGRSPRHHESRPSLGTTLRADVATVAEVLIGAGYATAAFVSNPAFELDPGLFRGFDVVGRHFGLDRPPEAAGPLCDELHGLARGWAHGARRSGRPFFLFINDVDPHSPYQPHPAQLRRLLRPDVTLAEIQAGRRYDAAAAIGHNFGHARLEARELKVLSDLYDAEIATIDAFVGKLLGELEADGALENTLVIVTSDHGEYLGEHGLLDHMHGVHREVLRVPLVVRAPGRDDRGRRVDDVVRLEDVAPTILEVCGIEPPAGLDGRSLLRELPGRVALGESPHNPFVATERDASPTSPDAIARTQPSRSVKQGIRHLIAHDDGRSELFDTAEDPSESQDVSDEHPGVADRLRALLE